MGLLVGCFETEQWLEQELNKAPWSCMFLKSSCRFRVEAAHNFSIGNIAEGGLHGSSKKFCGEQLRVIPLNTVTRFKLRSVIQMRCPDSPLILESWDP